MYAGSEDGAREVMRMLFLTLFVLAVVVICFFYVWPMLDGEPENPLKRATPGATGRQGDAAPRSRPESLEGVLTAQLMAGEITRGQYLKAVEGLAARDAERHPLTVPPEIGSADA
jgi:hypothetical protein